MTESDIIESSHEEVEMVGNCKPFAVRGHSLESCIERKTFANANPEEEDLNACIFCEGLTHVRPNNGKGASFILTREEIVERRLEKKRDLQAEKVAAADCMLSLSQSNQTNL